MSRNGVSPSLVEVNLGLKDLCAEADVLRLKRCVLGPWQSIVFSTVSCLEFLAAHTCGDYSWVPCRPWRLPENLSSCHISSPLSLRDHHAAQQQASDFWSGLFLGWAKFRGPAERGDLRGFLGEASAAAVCALHALVSLLLGLASKVCIMQLSFSLTFHLVWNFGKKVKYCISKNTFCFELSYCLTTLLIFYP